MIYRFDFAVFQNEDENDPNCKLGNCDDDNSNDIPDIYLPPNKRFWLITSVLGHLTDEDIPMLQQRLADVYRIAFSKYDIILCYLPCNLQFENQTQTDGFLISLFHSYFTVLFNRQQSVHLGLSNVTNETSLANETSPIIENKQSTNLSMPINPTSVLKYEYAVSESNASNIQPNQSIADTTIATTMGTTLQMPVSEKSETLNSNSIANVVSTININISDSIRLKRSMSSIVTSPIISNTIRIATTHATSVQPTQIILQSINAKSQSNISDISNSLSIGIQKTQRIATANMDKLSKANDKKRNDAIIGRISILIHNISVISSADKDYPDNSDKEWMHLPQRYEFKLTWQKGHSYINR